MREDRTHGTHSAIDDEIPPVPRLVGLGRAAQAPEQRGPTTAAQGDDMPDTAALETKSFSGAYVLIRKDGARPRRKHQSFDSAEREAQRLIGLHPGSSVTILREVACVKPTTVAPVATEGQVNG